jgi:hypothetical protein
MTTKIQTNPKTIRIGNSAFASPTDNFTNDPNGCYRIILLRSLGYEQYPATSYDKLRQSLTFALGHANEEAMTTYEEGRGRQVERERIISGELYGVPYEGHIDLTLDSVQLVELKSVSSINTYVAVFDKGEYKLNNLAQLVSYLYLDKKPVGTLRYTNFIYSPAAEATGTSKKGMSWGNLQPCYKEFLVEIDPQKDVILVDSVEIPYKVSHMLYHKEVSADVIKRSYVHPEPLKTKVCSFCQLRDICSKFNKKAISEKEWLSLAKVTFTQVKEAI